MREVEEPDLYDIFNNLISRKNIDINSYFPNNNFNFTNSGKGALSLILSYLRKSSVISDKTYELIVPEWIGYWVYNQVNQYAFPSKSITSKSRAILVYHQYGFPQDMNKIIEAADKYNLTIIEDCAHALDSKYNGKQLGSFGDFTIYSFSKFFFCLALGGVGYKDNIGFERHIKTQIQNDSILMRFFINATKMIHEYSLDSKNKLFQRSSNNFLNMAYSLYGYSYKHSKVSENIFKSKIDNEIKIRKGRYKYFLNKMATKGICEHLEDDDIAPYVIPIKLKESDGTRVLNKLLECGFRTGIYKFDMNRFLLEPKFESVLWILCHGGISDIMFENQIEILLENI